MSCILRVSGENFDVDEFIRSFGLPIESCWHKGELKFLKSQPNGRKNKSSGVCLLVSDEDFSELAKQISDALLYFRNNSSLLREISVFPGVEWAVLDFGVEIKPPWFSSYSFPPELLVLI